MDTSVHRWMPFLWAWPRRVVLIIAAATTSSCAAKINRFTVLPHDICKGTPVIADWDTTGGRARVSTEPPLNPKPPRVYLPVTTTTFILTVKPLIGSQVAQPNEVTVFDGSDSQPESDGISFENLRCQGGQVVGTADRPFSGWDPKLTVLSVESGDSRDVTVTHEGHHATLTAQNPVSNAFRGSKLGGAWTVSVPLLPSEKCDGTGAKPPAVVIVTAQVYCGS